MSILVPDTIQSNNQCVCLNGKGIINEERCSSNVSHFCEACNENYYFKDEIDVQTKEVTRKCVLLNELCKAGSYIDFETQSENGINDNNRDIQAAIPWGHLLNKYSHVRQVQH